MSQGVSVESLPTPCFLVDKDRVERNCARMLETCRELGVNLRPHTKTHKTRELADISTGGKRRGVTVSTLKEAEFFADAGYDDILYAFPIHAALIDRCLPLVKRLDAFHVMVSDMSGVECLKASLDKLPENKKWSVAIEIDPGYGRTGFLANSEDFVTAFREVISSMRLLSLYTHCGASYDIFTQTEREKHHRDVVKMMVDCKIRIEGEFPDLQFDIGVGSTPSCNLPSPSHKQLNEFHPGNYIFNDYEQYLLNVCRQNDIACRVMTRVIAHKPELSMIVLDCGFLALGHDGMLQRPGDFCLFDGDTNLKMVDMTQELGKVKAKEGDLDCRKYPVGTILYIYPYHSCLTAALHTTYYVHSGNIVVDTWKPTKGW